MFDIIGDVHGHADELTQLLEQLGYERRDGSWRHATRRVIFVGDLIDRGPQIREALSIVRSMYEAGDATVVMGNHELNALAFHTPDPDRPAGFLRAHSAKNMKQHAATLQQLSPQELRDSLQWFRQLPMWLELDGVRVVHACWDTRQISVIEAARQRYGGVSAEFLREATTSGTDLHQAVEDVLKGKEIELPDGLSYRDKDGHERSTMRIQWFRKPTDDTYASYALTADAGLPTDRLPMDLATSVVPYPPDAEPVFFGHYWLRAERPRRLAVNVACVDFSVAKGGQLCAYRWDGEAEVDDDKFVTVPAKE